MSEFKPTAAQALAINTRGSAVLVSAGAGSGKTKVLTERLMSRICDERDGVDLDKFLIITYTRAAAGELRGRIMTEIASALAKDPGNRRLRRQSALCTKAKINTIHGFCAQLLREQSHVTGLSADFRIIEEDRSDMMKAAALERVMEEHYAFPDRYPGFLTLADTVGAGRDDRRLNALVLEMHESMSCHARPEDWARAQIEALNARVDDASDTVWGREVLGDIERRLDYWCAEIERLIGLIQGQEKIRAAYSPSLEETLDGLCELRRRVRLGWSEAHEFEGVAFPALKGLRGSPDATLSDTVKARREACKKDMESVRDILSASSDRLLADMRLTAPAMQALLELTLDFDREFSEDKRRASVADYSDLEHIAARILTNADGSPSALARKVSESYAEIMVDEYQDVSRVQEEIFRAISADGKNLFMVGDVKQSIYRFRLADPEIFTEKYLSYADAQSAAPGEPRRILLQENFRSRREILDAANSVFSCCMSREIGDIDYDENAALKYGASYPGTVPKPKILLLSLPESDMGEESPDKLAAEAEMAAREIRALIDSGETVYDGGAQRPMDYGDIAVLMRSANSVGGVYRQVFARWGIPTVAGQGGGYFSSIEISTMMSLLAVIDNPHQDIPLIAVLRSCVFGFDADKLSLIRAKAPEDDFFGALTEYAKEDGQAAAFIERLENYRAMAPGATVSDLVWQLMDDTDMLSVCSAMADGEHRMANLMELIELCERFESSGYKGLHRFVLWLRRLAEKGMEPSVGAPDGSAVQIMTVHKSKGLEFPVVFLCDTGRRFNKRDSRDVVLVHPKLGLGSRVTDTKRKIEYPTLCRNAIKLRMEREMLSEEMRLHYVAMTRPRERLYITAAMDEPEEFVRKCSLAASMPMAPQVLSSASSPISWYVYAALATNEEHIGIEIRSLAGSGQSEESAEIQALPYEEELKELERRLSFRYPYEQAEDLPSKVTATELKHLEEPDGDAQSIAPAERRRYFPMPDFTRQERKMTGTERGVATHLVLQYMDFTKTGSLEEIVSEIERLRDGAFISQRESEAVSAQAIRKLFRSELGERMLAADRLHREFKFSLLVDAGSVFGTAEDEKLLLQGVVDCCIEENGELTVIDYKTDSVRTPEEISQRAQLYTSQVRAYAHAMRRIFRLPVRECVLYFLNPGKAVKIAAND